MWTATFDTLGVCVSNFRKGSIIKVNHWMALWSNHIKSLDAFCSSQKMGAAFSRSSASQMAEICPLPLLGTRTRPRTSNRGWKLTQLRIEVATVNKTPDRRSSRRSNKFIQELFGKALSAASKRTNLWKSFRILHIFKKLSTKKVWKLKCSKLLVWFVSGPDRLDGSETVFCCKADVDGGQTHQWHAFETLVIFFHALGPCARSRFTCKGGSASGLDAASCRFRRCNSLSLRLSMKLSCLVVVPVWLCASTLSQLFEDVFLGKLR